MSRDSGITTLNLDKTGYSLITNHPGPTRKVHRGTITLGNGVASNTATISPTTSNMDKLKLVFLGFTADGTTVSLQNHMPRIELTNATTVTASRNTANSTILIVGYEVWEECE